MPFIDRAATVAKIVLDHPECARIFRAYRIDFCCRGDLTVSAACAGKGLEADLVFSDLEEALADRAQVPLDARNLSTSDLIEYIVDRFHEALRKELPFVDQLSQKVARVHGDHNPKLRPLADLIIQLREILEPHLDDEEESLFPELVARDPDRARITRELAAMREEHLRVGEMLTRMRSLSDDYSPPEWACGSYRTLMRELEQIEIDTLTHVHIENHVLMTRFAGALRS